MTADKTSLSLLNQFAGGTEQPDWDRLVQLYSPLLREWLRKYDLQESDADDLIQDVLIVVSSELAGFQHNGRTGAFRSWLRSILVNRLRHWWRSRRYRPVAPGDTSFLEQLRQLDDPNSDLSHQWNAEHDRYLVRQLFTIVRTQVSEANWQAFHRLALAGETPEKVAADLGISRNAAVIAKHRVLKALRRTGQGLLND